MKNLVLLAILFLICNTGYAQSVPTVGEVYNFEIGDEFTYQGGSNSSTLGNHTSSEWVGITLITNRIDSFDNNSQLVAITYTKSFKKFDTISQYHQGTSWNDITNTAIENDITYTNLSDPVFSVCNIQDVACDDTSYINQVTIQDSILVTNFIKDNRYN
ncbi:MAG TPA: hypothetical protein VK174_15910, partial [Chitinophagales bacterium]|nr:hypothetical protein [Chitinophagales bacterium]